MTFTELKKEVGIESSGHLTFHLGKLHLLIHTTREGSYELNDDGRAALHLVEVVRATGSLSAAANSIQSEGGTKKGMTVHATNPRRRRILIAVAAVASITPIIILIAMGLASTIGDILNPCFTWGNFGGGVSAIVSAGGPCSSAGGTSATVFETLFFAGVIDGGIVVGAVLGCIGIFRARPLFLIAASLLLFAESAPLILGGEFILTSLPAAFFLWFWAISRPQRIPKGSMDFK